MSGRFPMDLGLPPLKVKNLTESKPRNSRFSVGRLGAEFMVDNAEDATPRGRPTPGMSTPRYIMYMYPMIYAYPYDIL